MKNIFLETERLILRRMCKADFAEILAMLNDKEVMYAWEYDFKDSDISDWIDKNLVKYNKYGLGYFLAEDKSTGIVVGQIALMPDVVHGEQYYEIGYILKREYWGFGYATEGALAMADYAYKNLGADVVILEIRPENPRSIQVAKRLGAIESVSFIKNVRGKDMKYLIYKMFMVR